MAPMCVRLSPVGCVVAFFPRLCHQDVFMVLAYVA